MSDAVPVLMPRLNPNDEHAVLVCWRVARGAWVEAEQVVATVETTKATFDVSAPVAGYALFDREPNSLVAIGAPLAWIADRADRPLPSAASNDSAQTVGGESRFTRKALRLMRQHGLSESDFPPEERVDAAHVERLARRSRDAAASANASANRLAQAPAKTLEIARLASVHQQAIPSTVVTPVAGEAVAGRLRRLAERLGPVTFLEAAIHDVGRALREYPDLNAFFVDGSAWGYTSINIGFAINLGRSLRVPVVRDADRLTYREIAGAVRDLALRYARDELTAADVADGTFTITDLSAQGVVQFVPVLNYRQSAILALCAERPATRERDLVLTFDHRLSDGMRAGEFLRKLAARLVDDKVD